METFKHNFTDAPGKIDVAGINGYVQALRHVYNHLADVTQFNPNKRFIDAVPLLDLIGNTNAVLAEIMSKEQKALTAEMSKLTLTEK